MKNTLLLFSCCFCAAISHAQSVIEWEKSFGGSFPETVLKIINTPDEGYLVGSVTESYNGDVIGNHGSQDMWLTKINSDGLKQWQKCLGGFYEDVLVGMDNAASGGYILTGNTNSNGDKNTDQVFGNHGGQDIWVVKVDGNGNIEWRRSFGGCEKDEARAIQQTADGNFVIVGGTQSLNSGDVFGAHGDWDAWILKIAPDGALIWQRTIGGSAVDYLYDIQETSTGKLIVAGLSSSVDGDLSGSNNHGVEDFWIAQLSPDGNLLWQKTYGGSAYDGARGLCLESGGDIIVTGATFSVDGDVSGGHGNSDAWVIRLNAAGNLLWQKPLGGIDQEYGASILQRTDNDFILVGLTGSYDGDVQGYHGGNDVWVVKFDKDGQLKTQVCLGGSGEDFARSAVMGTGNSVIVGGTSASLDGDVTQNHGGRDAWIVKLSVPLGLKPEAPNAAGLEIRISPNPASNSLEIATNVAGLKKVDIFSVNGTLIQTMEMDQLVQSLQIHALPAGAYLVRMLTQTGQVLSGQFVKI